MKICWNNLEKLNYNIYKNEWIDKSGKNNRYYKYKNECKYCKEPFLTSKYSNFLYCSMKCRGKSEIRKNFFYIGNKSKIKLNCLCCGKKFEVYPYRKDTVKYCSLKCRDDDHSKRWSGINAPNFGNRKYTDIDTKWKDYNSVARLESLLNYKQNKTLINPYNFTRGKYSYHLDHKYSIHDGFYNNVSIENISHPCNLQIITAKKNLKKHAKSCIKLNELKNIIETYNRRNKKCNSI